MKGLIIDSMWHDDIFSRLKTVEVRNQDTTHRGWIAVISAKHIAGYAELYDVFEYSTVEAALEDPANCVSEMAIMRRVGGKRKKWHGWRLRNAKRALRPLQLPTPQGAQIWIILRPEWYVSIKESLTQTVDAHGSSPISVNYECPDHDADVANYSPRDSMLKWEKMFTMAERALKHIIAKP